MLDKKEGIIMYIITSEFCEKLLKLSKVESFPKRKVIKKYENGGKAQENTVRSLAAFLGESNWKNLIQIN